MKENAAGYSKHVQNYQRRRRGDGLKRPDIIIPVYSINDRNSSFFGVIGKQNKITGLIMLIKILAHVRGTLVQVGVVCPKDRFVACGKILYVSCHYTVPVSNIPEQVLKAIYFVANMEMQLIKCLFAKGCR